MDDKILMWKNSTQYLYSNLTEIVISDEFTQITLKSNKQTVTICFKENKLKEAWLSTFNDTKKRKKTKENHIERAVFILPRDAVVEKMPLLPDSEVQDKGPCACCTIL